MDEPDRVPDRAEERPPTDPEPAPPAGGEVRAGADADRAGPPDGDGSLEPDAAEAGSEARPGRGRGVGAFVVGAVRRVPAEGWVSLGVLAVATGFVLSQLQPELLVRNTTPAGGDMGAHVWGPAYLRDHLLPQGRLAGWTPDWYAGFPAYQFYMVVPSLLILVLDVVLPYGIAFKLITVLGVLTLPTAAWAFGRLAGFSFPVPPLLAVATVPFLFERSFTIYGGNIPSTLAGEFAFSISLTLAVLYLGVVARGLDDGRHRALAAALLGLTVLCHLIPAIFALAGTAALFVAKPSRAGLRWLVPVLPVGAALAAFWALPFWWQRGYLNDMGWEKLATRDGRSIVDLGGIVGGGDPGWLSEVLGHLQPFPAWWAVVVLGLAAVGGGWSLVRRQRAGTALVILTAVWVAAFIWVPQGRLWNARLLPFLYLGYYLLAAIGLAVLGLVVARWVGSLVADEEGRAHGAVATRSLTWATAVYGLVLVLVAVGLPLGALPLGDRGSDGVYRWGPLETSERSFIPDWARWNYRGYEGKDSYREYYEIVQTMAAVGASEGCGRAMWEYEPELDRYGTPMALMLLPHWTDGCIGSMEGLYFESSVTTPYHFLNQSELSAEPSRAMRGLPYGELDLDQGIAHLQMLGVRYYLATSDSAIAAADAHPDLEPVASSGPWEVYEVADSDLVVPLAQEPVVLEGEGTSAEGWLEPSVDWYVDPERWDVALAADGPADWARVDVDDPVAGESTPLEPVEVTDVRTTDDEIAFSVSEPGTPVLVRSSYFPAWQVDGADGPYRVAPNLMVVVPTDTEVRLHYGRMPVEYVAWAVTLAGLVGVVLLAIGDRRRAHRATEGATAGPPRAERTGVGGPTGVEADGGDEYDDPGFGGPGPSPPGDVPPSDPDPVPATTGASPP